MREIIETLFFIGGNFFVWGQITSVILAIGLVLYGCWHFNKMLIRAKILRSCLDVSNME